MVAGLAASGCSAVEHPPTAAEEVESPRIAPAVVVPVPVVLRLPLPPDSVRADQKSLPLVPEGLVRAGDGRLYSTKDGAELVLIPGGEFLMGDDSSGEVDEKPAHRVSLPAFLIDRHEVTNAQFARFVAETGHRTDAEAQGIAHILVGDSFKDVEGAWWRHPGGPASTIEGMEEHPVVLVSWNDARAFCDWAGRRLPTEAEFERGLRAGVEGAKYPWGREEVPPRCTVNLCDDAAVRAHRQWTAIRGYEDGFPGTAPVGSFAQNALGLFDMSGNVWEWCTDWYDASAYGDSAGRLPQGPSTGEMRVNRGGGWDCDLFGARCACRGRVKPGRRDVYLGFRAAMDLR